MAKYLVKLVRDRVGELLADEPAAKEATYMQVPLGRGLPELRKKLIEEAAEYALEPSLAELADVLEVVRGLAEHDLGCTLPAVIEAASEKRRLRGGFDHLFGMWFEGSAKL